MEFRSVDQALRWAYRTTAAPVIKLSGIYAMRGPGSTAPDMTVMERRAQAALILAAVEALEPLPVAYVEANYGRFMTESSANLLRQYCRAALTPIRAERGIDLILISYLGDHVGWRAMGDALRCSQRDVPTIRETVFAALDALHERVLTTLETKFHETGLVVSEIVPRGTTTDS